MTKRGAYFPGFGWYEPPETPVDVSGEPPSGWVASVWDGNGAVYFPNAVSPGWYAPGVPSVDTSGAVPAGWVQSSYDTGAAYYFPNAVPPGWYHPDPDLVGATTVPTGWVATTSDDLKGVFFPAYGWFKPADAIDDSTTTVTEAVYIHAMNPAHIIYECLTNREWGRGLDRAMLSDQSFTKVAVTLYEEGLGLCLKWSRTDSIESFVQSVLDHIGGVLFTARDTGLLTLRLIRGGYKIEELPLFEPDTGLLEIRDATVAVNGLSVNEVKVTFKNPLADEDRIVKVTNLATMHSSGGAVNSLSKTYTGIPVPSLALRIAQRDLRAASTSLRRFTFVLDRRGYAVEPGSVICIRDNSRCIPLTPVRVGKIEVGAGNDGKIVVTAMQDVFGLPRRSYAGWTPSEWVPPDNKPCNGPQAVFEVPYFMLAGRMSQADLDYLSPNSAYVGTMSASGNPLNIGYDIYVRRSEPTIDDNPSGTEFACG